MEDKARKAGLPVFLLSQPSKMSPTQSKLAGLSQHRRALLLAAVAALGAMTLGYDTWVLGGRRVESQEDLADFRSPAVVSEAESSLFLPSSPRCTHPTSPRAARPTSHPTSCQSCTSLSLTSPSKALPVADMPPISSPSFGGAFFGSFFAMPVTHRLGHRYALQIASIIFIAGAMCQIARTDGLPALYTGRAISGFGIGSE